MRYKNECKNISLKIVMFIKFILYTSVPIYKHHFKGAYIHGRREYEPLRMHTFKGRRIKLDSKNRVVGLPLCSV